MSDFAEYRGYVENALKEIDIDAPAAFIDNLTEDILDDLKVYNEDYKIQPQDIKDWFESDLPVFADWLNNNMMNEEWIYDAFSEHIKYSIIYAMKENGYSKWPDVRDKVMDNASAIAASLDHEVPFPEIEWNYKGSSVRCNICLGTLTDSNYGYGTSNNLAKWLLKDDPSPFGDYAELGAISWLIQSQGNNLNDVKNGNGKFAKSLNRELRECGGYYGAPTFCVLLDVKDLEHLKAGGSLKIDPGTICGLVELYNGAGEVLGIELEKPVIVNNELIYELQVEGAKNRYSSVDSIYGLFPSCWSNSVELVDEKLAEPQLFEKAEAEAKSSSGLKI